MDNTQFKLAPQVPTAHLHPGSITGSSAPHYCNQLLFSSVLVNTGPNLMSKLNWTDVSKVYISVALHQCEYEQDTSTYN